MEYYIFTVCLISATFSMGAFAFAAFAISKARIMARESELASNKYFDERILQETVKIRQACADDTIELIQSVSNPDGAVKQENPLNFASFENYGR